MLMTNENVRFYPHDRLLGATVVKLVPKWIHPNQVTVLRFILTPIVLFLMWTHSWPWAFALFLFTAFTDALDGTLARVRKQITLWGTMADPIADKLLVGSVVILLVAREISVFFAAIIIGIELLILGGAIFRKRKGVYASANGYGKIKMLLQITGLALLMSGQLFGFALATPLAVVTLSIAIVFAIISLFTYGS